MGHEIDVAILESKILRHKRKYFIGCAEISDEEFDRLEDQLRHLKPDSFVLEIVGSPFLTDKKVEHRVPMLSLEKYKDAESVLKWMGEDLCIVTFKYDGSSASLIYRNGCLSVAKTRGNGLFGENITEQMQFVQFPLFIPAFGDIDEVEVRGEVCITEQNFKELSKEMVEKGMDPPKSIRNIVSGLLHRKTEQYLCKHLDFISYEILGDDLCALHKYAWVWNNGRKGYDGVLGPILDGENRSDNGPKKKFLSKLQLLRNVGFETPHLSDIYCVSPTIENVQNIIDQYQYRINHNYGGGHLFDGLVFVIDDLGKQAARGFTDHHPKGKMAFKTSSETKITTVRSIIVDVGRTGQLSFVGVVDPVDLSGAMVERVTLHNSRYIDQHRIQPGSVIEITRSGEVIPKHVSTISTPDTVYVFPAHCPVCGELLGKTKVNLVCVNTQCPARIRGGISHWISTLNIYDIGDSTITKLWDEGLVRSIRDLYALHPEQLAGLDKLGTKSANKIVKNIQTTKQLPIEKLLAGLGIDGLGRGVSKLLVKEFDGLSEMRCASFEMFQAIDGIGAVISANLVNGFKEHGSFLDEMSFVIDYPSKIGSSLDGSTFVITGSLSKPRKEIQSWIEERGGKVSSAISTKTSYLVCNDASNSSKYKKAVKLGVAIVTEQQLYQF